MKQLANTTDIIATCTRFDTPGGFFGNFPDAWASARSQVLKLETRQHYREPGNESLDAALAGHWEKALALIPEVRSVDDELYAMLRQNHVEFLRCRPITFPKSLYLRWEMEIYKYNASRSERISCCNRESLDAVFDQHAMHDFMVFDARLAFIHDYDADGLIVGGWMTTDQEHIRDLIALFGFIRANCQDFRLYLGEG